MRQTWQPAAPARPEHAAGTPPGTGPEPGPGLRPVVDPLEELRRRLVELILARATPERPDRLFPDVVARPTSFLHGAAGVLWALAETGEEVPEPMVDWLAHAVDRAAPATPDLDEGLCGAALALDALGRPAEAAQLWRRVEATPLDGLGPDLATGLPGMGLALLERAPVAEPVALVRRAHAVARELAGRLGDPGAYRRPGLLEGGAGAALFLLHVYELTDDKALLPAVADALRADLALLGWAPYADPGAPEAWRTPGTLATGAVGVAVVLHEAGDHLDDAWVASARASIAAACEAVLADGPPLTVESLTTVLGLQYIRSRPWEPAHRRLELVRPLLDHLAADAGDDRIPTGLADGLAGALLALAHLRAPGDRRLPFFW